MKQNLRSLPSGLVSQSKVSASIANIGSGFDSIGIGVGIYDEIKAETTDDKLQIFYKNGLCNEIPKDRDNLIIKGLDDALAFKGYKVENLKVECFNKIPQARGLGSSASAYISGLILANNFLKQIGPKYALNTEELVNISGTFEGHADNAAASVLGGAVVSWKHNGSFQAKSIRIHDDIKLSIFIPETLGFTEKSRSLLPKKVPLQDAVFNLSRSALLIHAIEHDPSLLFVATDDNLHQKYRKDDYATSYDLMSKLRGQGLAAFIGGAGPTVAILDSQELSVENLGYVNERNFTIQHPNFSVSAC